MTKGPDAHEIYVETVTAAWEEENESALDVLKAILKYGELNCVGTGHSWGSSGKKPSTKDVWTFPRHMLTRVEAAIARGDKTP